MSDMFEQFTFKKSDKKPKLVYDRDARTIGLFVSMAVGIAAITFVFSMMSPEGSGLQILLQFAIIVFGGRAAMLFMVFLVPYGLGKIGQPLRHTEKIVDQHLAALSTLGATMAMFVVLGNLFWNLVPVDLLRVTQIGLFFVMLGFMSTAFFLGRLGRTPEKVPVESQA